MSFISEFWYVWIIGLVTLPFIIVVTQLKNIIYAIDDKGKHPERIGKRFLSPSSLAITIIGGIGTAICWVLFLATIILAIIQQIKL
jgi:hypothetical protein